MVVRMCERVRRPGFLRRRRCRCRSGCFEQLRRVERIRERFLERLFGWIGERFFERLAR